MRSGGIKDVAMKETKNDLKDFGLGNWMIEIIIYSGGNNEIQLGKL